MHTQYRASNIIVRQQLHDELIILLDWNHQFNLKNTIAHRNENLENENFIRKRKCRKTKV